MADLSGFNPYAAGRKHYGGGRNHPNQGKTTDLAGYGRRDKQRQVKIEALKRRMGQ